MVLAHNYMTPDIFHGVADLRGERTRRVVVFDDEAFSQHATQAIALVEARACFLDLHSSTARGSSPATWTRYMMRR